jgi:hypothetical protein
MNRRQLLAGTGALIAGVVAGCNSQAEPPTMLGADTGLSVQNTRVIDDREEFVTDTDYPQDRNDGPPEVAFEAELTQPTDSPPEIEFRLTNTGPQRQFYEGAFYPFSALGSESGELVLLPYRNPDRSHQLIYLEPDRVETKGLDYDASREDFIPDSNDGSRWRSQGSPVKLSIGMAPELDHEETVSQRSTVLLGPNAQCPPAETQLVSTVLGIDGIRASEGPRGQAPWHSPRTACKTELVVELRVERL